MSRRGTHFRFITLIGVAILLVAGLFFRVGDDISDTEPHQIETTLEKSTVTTSISPTPTSPPVHPTAPRMPKTNHSVETEADTGPPETVNPLASDPELRARILDRIRAQKEMEYAGLHRPWLNTQPGSDEDRSALAEMLVEYDVWVASQMMPGAVLMTPSETQVRFEIIAEERSRLLSNIAERFGEETAESYDLAFPGPVSGQFIAVSDEMPPMPPIPPGYVPEQREEPIAPLPPVR